MATKKVVGKVGKTTFPGSIYVRADIEDGETFLWIEDEVDDIRDGEIVAVYELKKVVKAEKSMNWEEIK